MKRTIDLQEVQEYLAKQGPNTKIYLGADSERVNINDVWYADYTLVVVVHKNGQNGCKIFGEVVRERDYDQHRDRPRMRLMNEVMKVADLYLRMDAILGEQDVTIHLDINPNQQHGSSCVINEAVGYIRGMCNVIPMVKPEAWAASCAADRYKGLRAA